MVKAVGLTPGGLHRVPESGLGESRGSPSAVQKSAGGIVGRREFAEGPNGMEWRVGHGSRGQEAAENPVLSGLSCGSEG